MTEQAYPLITFYKGWEQLQRNLVEIVAPLSSELLALPIAPHHWSIGRLITHMIADRAWWFHGWMAEGNPDLAPSCTGRKKDNLYAGLPNWLPGLSPPGR